MRLKFTLLLFVLTFFSINRGFANSKNPNMFYSTSLKDEINSSSWRHILSSFKEAEALKSTAIIITMNTYGGELLYADSIRTRILNSKIPVYVFVDNNAASAGALISIACDKIFMRQGASIGAATVVNQTGEKMPDKYQSYMRSIMRATAESHGKDSLVSNGITSYKWKRDPSIAEAMVDERIAIPMVIDSGKILTFTTADAIKYGYCEGSAESLDELIRNHLGVSQYELHSYEPTLMDTLMGFLTGSMLRGVLIMLIIAGIYFELQAPGLGFPSVIAIGAAMLYFAPLYLDGLAANWEILIFVVGLLLIVLEIFVIPGFGFAGISGVVLVIVGLILSLIGNQSFNFESVDPSLLTQAIVTVLASLIGSALLLLYISSRIGNKGMFRKMALNTEESLEQGYVGVPMQQKELINKIGVAYTDLRPSGKVMVENEVYDAISEDGFVESGTSVCINRYETGQIYVSKN